LSRSGLEGMELRRDISGIRKTANALLYDSVALVRHLSSLASKTENLLHILERHYINA
jgi:hypothetical protein